jgi:hypothetical protein
MSKFNITEFIKKESKECEREYSEYLKVKAILGFNNKNKRTYQEMLNKRFIIESPDPSILPMPSEKLLNNV